MVTNGGEILRSTISGVWVALGSIALTCGIVCLAGSAFGWEIEGTPLIQCGGICGLVGLVLIAAGAVLFLGFRPRGLTSQ